MAEGNHQLRGENFLFCKSQQRYTWQLPIINVQKFVWSKNFDIVSNFTLDHICLELSSIKKYSAEFEDNSLKTFKLKLFFNHVVLILTCHVKYFVSKVNLQQFTKINSEKCLECQKLIEFSSQVLN